MDPKPHLLVPIYDIPFIREANVRSDLDRIAQKAATQNETNKHAVTLAEQLIIKRQLQKAPPEAVEIHELAEALRVKDTQDEQDSDNEQNKSLTLSEAARLILGDTSDATTVDRRIISVDMLRTVHSDAAESQEDTELYKIITDSRAASDTATEQGVYAAFIANEANSNSAPRTIESLELARYRAHIALEASRGTFTNKEEADEWYKRELKLLPTRIRAAILLDLQRLFMYTHNPDERGAVVIKGYYSANIKEGMTTVMTTINRIFSDNKQQRDIIFNTAVFDENVPEILNTLERLLESYQLLGKADERVAFDFARQLEELACCRIIDPQILGRAVMQRLKLFS